jgi:3-keto-5-aminohexanoate cleavage enzyme
MMVKKIINFAPTGTQPSQENSLAPLESNQIIEEVHEAYEYGITMTHIHARHPQTLKNSNDKNHYRPIIEGIRQHCPDLIICASLTGRFEPEFERRSEVLELLPDMGSLTMSSINFPTGESVNSPDMILKLIDKMKTYGVTPEIECFDSGMLNYTNYLINKGILDGVHYINVILGNIYNAQSDLATLSSILNNKPKNSILCLGGIGKEQLKSNIMGLLYADGVRIGLEDNLYSVGKNKTTNMWLLKRINNIKDELGFLTMTPKEFKDMGYGNRKINNIGV